MSFCREERGRTDRQREAEAVASPTLQIFDLARKMDMDGHEWGKKFERCAGSQSCTTSNRVPLPCPLLSSFQQCDYDEVNKNIRSAGVRPMTNERETGSGGAGAGGGGGASDERLKNERAAPRRRPAGRTPMSAVRLYNGPGQTDGRGR